MRDLPGTTFGHLGALPIDDLVEDAHKVIDFTRRDQHQQVEHPLLVLMGRR